MGKQIEYYSEMDDYKLIVNKAIELGLKIITKENNIITKIEDENIYKEIKCLYLEEAGSLILRENGSIDILESPIIEANPPYIKDGKIVNKSRLWVSSGYWESDENFIKRNKELEEKYNKIVRYLKKITNYIEIEVKPQNPDYKEMYLKKVYITQNIYNKVKNKEYEIV